jgi:hypothetical protein
MRRADVTGLPCLIRLTNTLDKKMLAQGAYLYLSDAQGEGIKAAPRVQRRHEPPPPTRPCARAWRCRPAAAGQPRDWNSVFFITGGRGRLHDG